MHLSRLDPAVSAQFGRCPALYVMKSDSMYLQATNLCRQRRSYHSEQLAELSRWECAAPRHDVYH